MGHDYMGILSNEMGKQAFLKNASLINNFITYLHFKCVLPCSGQLLASYSNLKPCPFPKQLDLNLQNIHRKDVKLPRSSTVNTIHIYLMFMQLPFERIEAGISEPMLFPQNFPKRGEPDSIPSRISRKSVEQPPRASTSNASTVRLIHVPFGCEMRQSHSALLGYGFGWKGEIIMPVLFVNVPPHS